MDKNERFWQMSTSYFSDTCLRILYTNCGNNQDADKYKFFSTIGQPKYLKALFGFSPSMLTLLKKDRLRKA